MKIFDTEGELVFRVTASCSGGMQGGAELFLESGEPEFSELTLEELLERFPEGEYEFEGKGVENEHFVGSAMLTHAIPDGPELLFPLEDDGLQDPNNTTVMRESVGPADGIPIIAYQVIVEFETEIDVVPKVVLDVMMPATATSMLVPPGFLLPEREYEWEVLAIEEGGIQTLSSAVFETSP